MSYQVGDLIIGKVKSVKPYAIFMSFENNSQGLLHISEISDRYIKDIEKYATIGDELKVKVLSVDPTNGFLRVSFKQVPPNEAYSTHTNSNRNTIEVSENSFKELEEKLPSWIEETLKKAKGENK